MPALDTFPAGPVSKKRHDQTSRPRRCFPVRHTTTESAETARRLCPDAPRAPGRSWTVLAESGDSISALVPLLLRSFSLLNLVFRRRLSGCVEGDCLAVDNSLPVIPSKMKCVVPCNSPHSHCWEGLRSCFQLLRNRLRPNPQR